MATDENQKKSRSKEIKSKYEMWKPNQKVLILEKDITLSSEFGFLFFVSLAGFDLSRQLCWRKIKFKRFRDSRAWRRKRLDFSCSNSHWTSDWSLSAACWWADDDQVSVTTGRAAGVDDAGGGCSRGTFSAALAREPKLALSSEENMPCVFLARPLAFSSAQHYGSRSHASDKKLRLSPTLGKETWLELFQLLFQTISVGSQPDRYDKWIQRLWAALILARPLTLRQMDDF